MGTLGNMDGSFDGVLKASEQLKGLPKIIQKYMTAGIFQDELGWAKHFDDDSIDKLGGVDSFIVQIMNLDKAQQDALLSVSKFSDGLKEEIERLLVQIKHTLEKLLLVLTAAKALLKQHDLMVH